VIQTEEMTDEQFGHFTLELLQKELGPDGTARFLRTSRSGSGDYTRDRHKWLDGLTMDEILDEAQRLETSTSD
jgi:hypothetical protein